VFGVSERFFRVATPISDPHYVLLHRHQPDIVGSPGDPLLFTSVIKPGQSYFQSMGLAARNPNKFEVTEKLGRTFLSRLSC
jgi:hypothetical protein